MPDPLTVTRPHLPYSGRRRRTLVIQSAMTVVVVVLLLKWIDLGAVVSVLVGADMLLLLPVLALRPLVYLVRSLRVWLLLNAEIKGLPMASVLAWHGLSFSLAVFTPGGLGELSFVYFLRRYKVETSRALAVLVVDKIVNLFALTSMALVGATLYTAIDGRWWWSVFFVVSCALILVTYLLSRSTGALSHRVGARWQQAADTFRMVVNFFWIHPSAFFLNLAGAGLQSLILSSQIWLCFQVFHTRVDFWGVFWLSSIGRLINMVPITVSGIGIYEGSMVYLMGALEAAHEVSLASVLLPRTISWTVAAMVMVVFLWWRPRMKHSAVGDV